MLRIVGKSAVNLSGLNNIRNYAAPAVADPIQKLFLQKINEYKSKAQSAAGGLVDADPKVQKAIQEDMERIRRQFNIKEGEEAKLDVKFSDKDFKVDPINMADWK